MLKWVASFIIGMSIVVTGFAQTKPVSMLQLSKKMDKTVVGMLKASEIVPSVSEQQTNHLFQQGQFAKALPHLQQWAALGSARAQLELGFLYEFGRGVKQNSSLSAKWYYLAIVRNAYNQKPLMRGLNYYFGQNQHSVNRLKAAQWFRMAAELGYDAY